MTPTNRYLNLLKKSLINELYIENEAKIMFLVDFLFANNFIRRDLPLQGLIHFFLNIETTPYYELIREVKRVGAMLHLNAAPDLVQAGSRLPLANFLYSSHTMVGRLRIDNVHQCLDMIRQDDITGDFIETGVWKGGVTIFMKAYLDAYEMTNRQVWLADSFQGLPKPERPQDAHLDFSRDEFPCFAVSQDEVEALFVRYGVMDERVRFLPGWFKDTLPTAPINQLALLRLDGDLYESTMVTLESLYHKVTAGGFIIVDDYHGFVGCQEAVDRFRAEHGIAAPLQKIDYASVFWRKE